MVSKGYLAIPSKYDKLITSLRTAYATEYSLDKEQTSYSDSLDALRLSLKGYNIKWKEQETKQIFNYGINAYVTAPIAKAKSPINYPYEYFSFIQLLC